MTKREQYGLSFSRYKSPTDGRTFNVCKKVGKVDRYNTLQIIGRLDEFETIGLIEEIGNALNEAYYEEYFTTDSTECDSIQLSTPNVIFGEHDLVIPLSDLKLLLHEWVAFIST